MLQADSTVTLYGLKKILYHFERVFPDTESWIRNKNICESFFRLSLLPELKFYSRTKTVLYSMDNTVVNNPNNDNCGSQKLYCHFQSEEFGEMIACDSITCSIEWFHVNVYIYQKYLIENGTALIVKN